MNSIDKKQKKVLIKFYNKEILRLHKVMERSVLSNVKKGEDESYFLLRKQTRMKKSDFELSLGSQDQIAKCLENFWSGTPLQPLAKELIRLTPKFSKLEESDEVSPFIYEMF